MVGPSTARRPTRQRRPLLTDTTTDLPRSASPVKPLCLACSARPVHCVAMAPLCGECDPHGPDEWAGLTFEEHAEGWPATPPASPVSPSPVPGRDPVGRHP